ncbi:MAG: hypothetical protein ACXU8U_04680 [Asticcacaulis sp.]
MASTSTPGWVKVFIAMIVIAVIAVAGLHLFGLAPHMHHMALH